MKGRKAVESALLATELKCNSREQINIDSYYYQKTSGKLYLPVIVRKLVEWTQDITVLC